MADGRDAHNSTKLLNHFYKRITKKMILDIYLLFIIFKMMLVLCFYFYLFEKMIDMCAGEKNKSLSIFKARFYTTFLTL